MGYDDNEIAEADQIRLGRLNDEQERAQAKAKQITELERIFCDSGIAINALVTVNVSSSCNVVTDTDKFPTSRMSPVPGESHGGLLTKQMLSPCRIDLSIIENE